MGAGWSPHLPPRSSRGHREACPPVTLPHTPRACRSPGSLSRPSSCLRKWPVVFPGRCKHVPRACCLCATCLGPLGPGPPCHEGQESLEQGLLSPPPPGVERLSPWLVPSPQAAPSAQTCLPHPHWLPGWGPPASSPGWASFGDSSDMSSVWRSLCFL